MTFRLDPLSANHATVQISNLTFIRRELASDTTPPDTTIATGPAASSNSGAASFSFTSTKDNSTFHCQLDGGGYTTCTSPVSYSSLADGLHIFSVKAIDAAGNEDPTPAEHQWTIDTIPPTAPTVGGPVLINNTRPQWTWNTGGGGNGTYRCQIDSEAGAWLETSLTTFTPVNSLSEGSHTLYVQERDAAGNWSDSGIYTTTVDATSPAMPLVSGPTPTNNPQPVWTWTSGGGGNGTFRYKLDSGDLTIGATETTATTYTQLIALSDGEYTLYVQERDAAGNWSLIGSKAVVVDTTAPALTLSTLSDNSWTNNETLNISGTVTDDIGVKSLTINAVDVTINPDGSFSHALVLQSGANQITTVAEDTAGNQTTDVRTITLDKAAPVLVVSLPADNSKTNQSSIEVSGTVDETSLVTIKVNAGAAVTPRMNNNAFTMLVTLANGINTIEVTASDQAGNTASVKRTVTYDDQNPVLSITEPNQDIRTNTGSIILRGEVSDSTNIIVTIAVDGATYTPSVTNGMFEQVITFTTEKTYNIHVKAVDEAGNEAIAQRNVVYDTTPPPFSINPVMSPTALNSQAISGTVEAAATVAITCPTAAVGPVIYPTLTTWSATLTGLSSGANDITVTATDEVGNNSTLTTQIVLSSTTKISGSAYFYPENPTYKATFSLDVTGSTAPSGWLKYYYARTRMNFVSTGITGVSLSGNIATITGTGTVNGVGGYTFTATVIDGAPDKFGITIRKSDGSTYYSAGPGSLSGGDFVLSLL